MTINKIKKLILYTIPCFFLMAMSVWYINVDNAPKIFGDEYGYWAAGAHFARLDWRELTSLNDYYGWGYGVLLSIILRLPISFEKCYHIAIGLNGVFLCIIYFIALKFISEISTEKNEFINVLIAFTSSIMPSTLYYSRYTLAEAILSVCYWTLIYLVWKILTINTSKIYEILFIVVNAFMLSVHLRTIGIIFFSILFLMYVHGIQNGIHIKKMISSIVFFFILLVLINIIKMEYRNSYANVLVDMKTGNDISGQVRKLSFFFSQEGFFSFIKLFLGRFYSTLINSFFFIFVVIVNCIEIASSLLKSKKVANNQLIVLYAILCTFSEIAISALSMIGHSQGRFDILTYSRYHEFTIGIIILFGLIMIMKNQNLKIILNSYFLMLILTIIVSKIQEYATSTSHVFFNTPFLFYYVINNEYKNLYMLITINLIFINAFFQVIIKYNKKIGILCTCVIMSIYTILMSNYAYTNGCLKWSVEQEQENNKLINFIVENQYNDRLSFMVDDDVLKVDQLQFMLREDTIHIMSIEQIKQMENIYILTTVNYDNSGLIESGYQVMCKGDQLMLWGTD